MPEAEAEAGAEAEAEAEAGAEAETTEAEAELKLCGGPAYGVLATHLAIPHAPPPYLAPQVGARPGVLPAARLHHWRRAAALVGRGKLQIPQAQQHAQRDPLGVAQRLRP